MSKLAKVALLSVALTTLPAVAADPAREPVGSGIAPDGAERRRAPQGMPEVSGHRARRMHARQAFRRTGRAAPIACRAEAQQGRQEVPGTGTTVPR